jgi:hypothetical protein
LELIYSVLCVEELGPELTALIIPAFAVPPFLFYLPPYLINSPLLPRTSIPERFILGSPITDLLL